MKRLLSVFLLLTVLVMPVLAAETEEWVEPEEPVPAETEPETLETYRLAINVMFKPEAAYEDYDEVSFRVYDETMQKYLVCEYTDEKSGYIAIGYSDSEDDDTLLVPKHGVIMFAQFPAGKYTFENVSAPEDFALLKEKFTVCISDGEATLQSEYADEATEFPIADDGFMSVTVVLTEQVVLPNCNSFAGYVYQFLGDYGHKILGATLCLVSYLLVLRFCANQIQKQKMNRIIFLPVPVWEAVAI